MQSGHEFLHTLTDAFFGFEADSGSNGTLRLSRSPADENFMVDGIELGDSLLQPALTLLACCSVGNILVDGKCRVIDLHRTF